MIILIIFFVLLHIGGIALTAGIFAHRLTKTKHIFYLMMFSVAYFLFFMHRIFNY